MASIKGIRLGNIEVKSNSDDILDPMLGYFAVYDDNSVSFSIEFHQNVAERLIYKNSSNDKIVKFAINMYFEDIYQMSDFDTEDDMIYIESVKPTGVYEFECRDSLLSEEKVEAIREYIEEEIVRSSITFSIRATIESE